MSISDYLSNPHVWNALGGVGETLQAMDQGRPSNMQPYYQQMAAHKKQSRVDDLRDKIFGGQGGQGILGQMNPQQQQALSLMYEADPNAAVGMIAQQAFPADGDPYARYKVVGGRLVDMGAQGGPSVAIDSAEKDAGAQSAIAKLTADWRNGLISDEDYVKAREKVLAQSQGITIGPDGTIQIGGANAPTAVKTEAIKGKNAYDSIMSGLDSFEALIEKQGATILPGEGHEAYNVARRSLQLQMKELFNLGVLNGPDLALMDQLLIDPTDLVGAAMDATGYASVQERGKANIKQLRQMMKELIEPKLRSVGAAGVSGGAPSVSDMSDDALLRALGRQ